MFNISKFNVNSLIPKYKYKFISDKSKDFTDKLIFNAICVLPRGDYIGQLNKIIMDIELALLIELGVFEFSLVYILNNNLSEHMLYSIYIDRFNDILINLNGDPKINNNTLLNDIKTEKIQPQFLAFQTPECVHPQRMETYIKKKLIKEQRNSNIASSDVYKCKKCGEKKVRINLVQTRSADEPSTLFVTCLVCYYTFKK